MAMYNDLYEEQQVPSAQITSIGFNISTQTDTEKISVLAIHAVSEVNDPRLGLPNLSSQCSTCGTKNLEFCAGHFGCIQFPFTILHPCFLLEAAKILNKICPMCKSIREELRVKQGGDSVPSHNQRKGCKYCLGNSTEWCPTVKFKVSSRELFRKSAIIVEVNDRLPKKHKKKFFTGLPADFWDFIPKDEHQEESNLNQKIRVLSHAQVHYLLKCVDLEFIKKFVLRTDSLFLNCFPVTPNCHRVSEVPHAVSDGQQLVFDERSRAYRKLVSFRGTANELGSCVQDCLKFSKLSSGNSSNNYLASAQQKNTTDPSSSSGLRWIKDVVLGKRNNHCFRMVVVGDSHIKLSEIGIPCHIAEKLQKSEHLNRWNFDKFSVYYRLSIIEKGEFFVLRKGRKVSVHHTNELQMGDTIYRPLNDGDIVLINRPPSIHQHSLIALSVKVLPISSVLSINPLCCSPLRGDFDGDCLHGFVPQSINATVELSELVALDRQVMDGQNGRNLLSLSQDSLTAAHLIMDDGVFLNAFQMQQLQMYCPNQLLLPAIVKNPSLNSCFWTGKQLFSMFLPPGFDYVFPSNGVHVSNGELLSSEGAFWLCDKNSSSIFQSLAKHCRGKVLDFLYPAQEVLSEWLSMQGLSVSLSDLYLSSDSYSRESLMEEISFGLGEAEQKCNFQQLMVDSCQDFLVEGGEENAVVLDLEHFCYERQKSAALCQVSADAFKQVFRDIQNLVYRYANKDNSLLVMFKAGSKGNLMKLVQHSMCLGLQHSLVRLSFRIPRQLSCDAWNNQKALGSIKKVDDTHEHAGSYIPSAVVENSFLTGLNPLECFVHSVTSRDSSFSANADLPGTLNRRLMFLMRDLNTAYDGTVRNAYGNQLIQFSYDINNDTSTPNSTSHYLFGEGVDSDDAIGGQPVGSWSASAISEVAYSALDQPVSLLETSPLLNLKNVLECGSRKHKVNKTCSIFLSENLGRRMYGFEYGALEVKNRLERLLFSDIVSTVMIIYSPQTCVKTHFSPWVCHFHVFKEIANRRGLKVQSIINALHMRCNSSRIESNLNLPNLEIIIKDCSIAERQKEDNDVFCITVTIPDISESSSLELDSVRGFIIPFLLGTIVQGFPEINKVDILWNDWPKISKHHEGPSGELYLRVVFSVSSDRTNLWSLLLKNCNQTMDLIDWSRSHPDNVRDIVLAFGIEAGWKYFLKSLESAISDAGKSIHPQHLVLVADSLSATGEFVSLNARGIAQQREHASVSSPFMQACYSGPGACFIKAAKAGVVDDLKGNLDALAWGNVPSTGTGGHFDIIYSGKRPEFEKPVDVFSLMGRQSISDEQNVKIKTHVCNSMSDISGTQSDSKYDCHATEGLKKLESLPKSLLGSFWTPKDIPKMSNVLKRILHKYPINHTLKENDKSRLLMALHFHPRRDEKFGTGAEDIKDIKVVRHPKYRNTRCFEAVRMDGTSEVFSYHKCVLGALDMIDPQRAKSYKSKVFGLEKENTNMHVLEVGTPKVTDIGLDKDNTNEHVAEVQAPNVIVTELEKVNTDVHVSEVQAPEVTDTEMEMDITNVHVSEVQAPEVTVTGLEKENTDVHVSKVQIPEVTDTGMEKDNTNAHISEVQSPKVTDIGLDKDNTNEHAAEVQAPNVIVTELEKVNTDVHVSEVQAPEVTDTEMEMDITNVHVSEVQAPNVIVTGLEKVNTDVHVSEVQAPNVIVTGLEKVNTDVHVSEVQAPEVTVTGLEKENTDVHVSEVQIPEVTDTGMEKDNTNAHISEVQSPKVTDIGLDKDNTNEHVAEVQAPNVIVTELEKVNTNVHVSEVQAPEVTDTEMEMDITNVHVSEVQGPEVTDTEMEMDIMNVHVSEVQAPEVIDTGLEKENTDVHVSEVQAPEVTVTGLEKENKDLHVSEIQIPEVTDTGMEKYNTDAHVSEVQAPKASDVGLEKDNTDAHVSEVQAPQASDIGLEKDNTDAHVSEVQAPKACDVGLETGMEKDNTNAHVSEVQAPKASDVGLKKDNTDVHVSEVQAPKVTDTGMEKDNTDTGMEKDNTNAHVSEVQAPKASDVGLEKDNTDVHVSEVQIPEVTDIGMEKDNTNAHISEVQSPKVTDIGLDKDNTNEHVAEVQAPNVIVTKLEKVNTDVHVSEVQTPEVTDTEMEMDITNVHVLEVQAPEVTDTEMEMDITNIHVSEVQAPEVTDTGLEKENTDVHVSEVQAPEVTVTGLQKENTVVHVSEIQIPEVTDTGMEKDNTNAHVSEVQAPKASDVGLEKDNTDVHVSEVQAPKVTDTGMEKDNTNAHVSEIQAPRTSDVGLEKDNTDVHVSEVQAPKVTNVGLEKDNTNAHVSEVQVPKVTDVGFGEG